MNMNDHGHDGYKPSMAQCGRRSTLLLSVSDGHWMLPFALCWVVQLAHEVFSLPPLASVAPRMPPGTIQRGAQNITENNVSRDSPMPRDQTCRQRCYFGRRLLDQTKHSGETAEPNKCLPHILGYLCNSPRSWYASPRLTAHGLAPVQAHGRCLVSMPLFETRHHQRVGMGTGNGGVGDEGTRGLGNGHLAMGSASGKREAGALSIAGVTLTLFAVRGSLANLSGEFITADLSGSLPLPAPSPAGQSFARA